MKFDFVIGNPPYQDNRTQGENKLFVSPIYHFFMEAAFNVAPKVELVTPARFLFNAGATPTEWNAKMMNDEHFKVLRYAQNSETVFPGIKIMGGGCNLLSRSNLELWQNWIICSRQPVWIS